MVKNTRQDEHFTPGIKYLMQIVTDAAGNYQAHSLDPKAVGKIVAHVNKDGKYSVEQFDADGNQNHIVSGGSKKANKSETKTTAEHSDAGVGGGSRANVGKGDHKESGGSSSSSTNGPAMAASAESAKTMAPGGDGHHGMKGNQSFIVDEGSMTYSVAKNFSVVTKEAVQFTATKDIFMNTSENIQNVSKKKYGVKASKEIVIDSDISITFQVGKNKIIINQNGISISTENGPIIVFSKNGGLNMGGEEYVSLTSYGKDVTLGAEKGVVETNGKNGTKVQSGGAKAPPTTFK